MRKILLVATTCVTLAVAAACGSSSNNNATPTPTGSPTASPTGTFAFAVVGSGATAEATYQAAVRVLGPGTAGTPAVLYCATSMISAAGAFNFSTSGILAAGTAYTAELVLNSEATGAIYGPGDAAYSFTNPSVTSDWTINFAASTAATGTITWTPGTACPGE